MNTFFKTLFASCLGTILALLVLSGISTLIIGGIASRADKPKPVKANSVLHLTFDDPIPELTNNTEFMGFKLKQEEVLGLQEIKNTLENAAGDEKIKGVFLEVDALPTGLTGSNVLREALAEFKASGKFILAYSDFYGQQAYYLSSVADEVMVNPIGLVDFRGLSATVPFFKPMLDKIGVDMQVFYAGKFKSATEPFRRTDMSPENKLQTRAYLEDLYEDMLNDIASTRPLTTADLHRLASDFAGLDPEQAKAGKLVDRVCTRSDALQSVRERLGLSAEDDLQLVGLRNYNQANPPSVNYKAGDKIAVVYAEGTITGGTDGENGVITDRKYAKILRDLQESDNVKAVVLRINSPGGSALASENILAEIRKVQEKDIPVVVSMGDFAASGGYYIACSADSILAEPTTITGSIGVFSVFPSVSELMNDKIGITFDTVLTDELSAGLNPVFSLNAKESRLLQQRTDQMYEEFLARVAEGRSMTRDEVHEIAQGRVWTGEKAVELRLVDRLDDLDGAIATAARMAGLEDGSYRVSNYPKVKDPLMQLLEELSGGDMAKRKAFLKKELGSLYPHYKYVKEITEEPGVQARLPYIVEF